MEDGKTGVPGVFISYARTDLSFAQKLEALFQAEGFRVWRDQPSIVPGEHWPKAIGEAIEKECLFLLLWSINAAASPVVELEWNTALAHQKTIVPVFLDKTPLPAALKSVNGVFLDERDPALTVKKILEMTAKLSTPLPKQVQPSYSRIGERSVAEQPHFPPTLPLVWNVPNRRNPNFTGREEILTQLERELMSGRSAAITQTLSGLGGVGKTQVAIEYVYRHTFAYELIWWVRGEELATMIADLAALAYPLDLPEKQNPKQEIVLNAVRRYLDQTGKWLLVFDNVEKPEDLKTIVPQGNSGHIIITSRNPVWRQFAHPITVPVFPRPESVIFLIQRIGQADEVAASQLSLALGDLPLALEQAGAYIESCKIKILDYLKLFNARATELLRLAKDHDYPYTVATTWEISFQKLEQECPAGADLLNLCAFLAPDNIPKDLIVQASTDIPPVLASAVADELTWNEVLANVCRYSLMEVVDDSLFIHRLVQMITRERLDTENRKRFAEATVKMVSNAFPSGDFTLDMATWQKADRILSHCLSSADNAQALAVAPIETSLLYNQAGIYYIIRCRFQSAHELFEKALAIREKASGSDNTDVARILNNIGFVLGKLSDLPGAKLAHQKALAIEEKALGADHFDVSRDYNNLGIVLMDMGNFAEAKTNFEKAIAIMASKDPNHQYMASYMTNLGAVLEYLGDFAHAREFREKALATAKAAFGADHPVVGQCYNNIGCNLRESGQWQEGIDAYKQALAIIRAAFGEQHPEVAGVLQNLGTAFQAFGELDQAQSYFEQALAINEAIFGPSHPQVSMTLRALSILLLDKGNLEEAKAKVERALAIDEKYYDSNHPTIADGLDTLATILRAMSDLQKAKKNLERALAIYEAVYGPHHFKIAIVLNHLGLVLLDVGNSAMAQTLLKRALTINEAVYGSDHIEVAASLNNLALVLEAEEDYTEARRYYERALQIYTKFLGIKHNKTLSLQKKIELLPD